MRAGGCDFPVDPRLAADQAQVWWRPELDADLIQLQPAPPGTAASALAAPSGGPRWTLGHGRQKIRLALLSDAADPGQALAAVVPLDAAAPLRLRALGRLWRHLEGGPPPPDPITAQRRRRLKAMLRALDGRGEGAAYRRIAEALYGETRVAREAWKSSSLRDATLRLVRDGAALVGGGYVGLLGGRSTPA